MLEVIIASQLAQGLILVHHSDKMVFGKKGTSPHFLHPNGMCEGGEVVGEQRGYNTGAAPTAPVQEEAPTSFISILHKDRLSDSRDPRAGRGLKMAMWGWFMSTSFEHLRHWWVHLTCNATVSSFLGQLHSLLGQVSHPHWLCHRD